MFRKVIIGIDGISGGADTIGFARAVAPTAELILASAFSYEGDPSVGVLEGYPDALRAEVTDTLEAVRSAAGIPNAELVAVGSASPGRALSRLAEERGADLLVIGASRHAAIGRLLLGDTSRAALRGAPCGVAVVPRAGKIEHPPRRIGVAFDRSPQARVALAEAVALATQCHASIEIVDAVETGVVPEVWGFQGAGYMEDLRLGVEQQLRAVTVDLPVPATAFAALGSPAVVLGDLAGRVDLVVCGSRGWGPIARVTLGSTSDRLIHHASCPVLVIPKALVPETDAEAARPAAGPAQI